MARQKKEEVAYDPQVTQEFIKKVFELQREMNTLREDMVELKKDYKKKIKQSLIANVIKIVKAKLVLSKQNVSDQTIGEVEEMVKDKINMIM